MEHVVFFPAPDGTPAFRRAVSLEESVRLVEHLRNVEGVAEVSVHALGAEVPLAFRTWYRVELPQTEAVPGLAPLVPEQPVDAPVEPVGFDAPATDASVAEAAPAHGEAEPLVDSSALANATAGPNGHGEGPKSLGFFAT